MSKGQSLLILCGRMLMSALFLTGAYWHLTSWDLALAKMVSTHIQFPAVFLIAATILLTAGGTSLFLGYHTKAGIILLLFEITITAVLFNPFWNIEGSQKAINLLAFLSRMSICGGLLILLSRGPGLYSLDHLLHKKG